MAFRDGEHVEAGPASRYQFSTDAVGGALPDREDPRLPAERPEPHGGAGVLFRLPRGAAVRGRGGGTAPARARHGRSARRTLAALSITTTDGTDHAPVCFHKVVGAVTDGYLFEAADHPNASDPLHPHTQQLLWLADRIRGYVSAAAARIAKGHLL